MEKSYLKITIALIIVLCTFSLALTQKPLPRIMTGEDFLGKYMPPGVYDIEVDTNGFVYFVYPGGLWKFNGNSTENKWKLENPYDQIIYYALHKGYDDQILLSGPFGVAQIKGDSILKYPLPYSLVQFGMKGYESVYTDKNGLLHIAPRHRGYFTVDTLGNTEEVAGFSLGVNGFVATRLEDGKSFIYSIDNESVNKPYSLYSLNTDSNLKHISEIERPLHESSLVPYQNGSLMFSNGNNDLVHFDDNGLIKVHVFDHDVNKLFIDSRDFLWVGTANNGFFKVKSPQFIDLDNYLDGSSAVLAEGFDNGLWLKSDTRKFGYISSLEVLNYSDQNGYPMFIDIFEIVSLEEQVIISNNKNQTFILNGDEVTELNPPGIVQRNDILKNCTYPSRFCFDKNTNKIWVANCDELQSWNGHDWEILKFDKSEFNSVKVRDLQTLADGRTIGATQNEIFEIIAGKIVRISEYKSAKILHFSIDDLGKIWVGSDNGLWILENGKFNRPYKKMSKELLTPSQFITNFHGAILYQPIFDALYRIKNDTISPVHNQYGKRIKLFTYSISPKGDFWAIEDDNGKLCILEFKNDTTNLQYFAFDDFSSFGISKLAFLATDKEIFIGSRFGVFKKRINELTTEEIPSKVKITEIRINHELVPINNSYELSHDENYINLTFDGLSFRRFELEYSYQMHGLDTIWRETKHKHVQYTNLPPGQYDFMLRVKTSQTDWSNPKTITFFIDKPYWQKWWFWITSTLLLLLIATLGIQLRINNVRKKESEKGRIALELSRLEMRALKAQMNPHFIFNTLKSIQNRILKEGKWEANELLVRFSKLIRTSLEYSRVDFISLKKEIEFLNNYLEIEKQRIPGKFDYEIIIDKVEDIQDLLVPALLIQPICENAINHAFEESKGKLTLKLKLVTQDLIEVQIIDDGIGFFKPKNINHNSTPSRGLEIVQSRMELFKAQGYDTLIRIEPLNEITNQGTKVTIRSPCK